MQVSVQVYFVAIGSGESHRQVEAPFAAALSALAQTEPAFERMGRLAVMLTLSWPFPPTRPSGSFSRSDATFYARAEIDYPRWVRGDWADRVAAYADGVARAVRAIHKTRIDQAERERLLELVEETRVGLTARAPRTLEPIGPVWLIWHDDNEPPAVSSARPRAFGGEDFGRVVQMTAIEALDAVEPPAPGRPSMFKLYRRVGKAIEYREAWPTDGLVVEHHGVCGTVGETVSHPAGDDAAQARLLKALTRAARDEGFRPIPDSRRATLIVRRRVKGDGSTADLDRRHSLEDFLDDRTGWLGLGHCDGGSIGGGWMESFCYVVNFEIARKALAPELAAAGFADFEIVRGARL